MKGTLLALLSLVVLAVPAFAQVSVKYDEFRQRTTVVLEPDITGGAHQEPSLHALAARESVSKDPAGPHITLGFFSSSENWEYLDCPFLHALADGTPVDIGESKHDGSVEDGYVIEYVDVHINLAALTKLANAKEVKFKLCNTVIPLSLAKHAELVQFLAELTGKSKSTTDVPAAAGTEPTPPVSTQPVQTDQATQNPSERKDLLGWRDTRWGMTVDEVLKACPEAQEPKEKPEALRYPNMHTTCFLVVPDLEIAGKTFEARFLFADDTKLLKRVLLRITTPGYSEGKGCTVFDQVALAIIAKYGQPTTKTKNTFNGDVSTWLFPTSTITLECIPDERFGSLSIQYKGTDKTSKDNL